MLKVKKAAAIILLCMVLVSFLFGCGAGNSGTGEKTPAAGAETVNSTAAAESSGNGATGAAAAKTAEFGEKGDSKERGAEAVRPEETESKEGASKEDETEENGPEENGSKEGSSKETGSEEGESEKNEPEENGSKEGSSKETGSEEGSSKETGSEEGAETAGIEIPENPYFREDGGVSIDVFAMDTYMTLLAYGDRAEHAVLAAAKEIHSLDDRLSTGNPDSEISKLNASGGGAASELVIDLVRQSLTLYGETSGLFDIAIYPVMKLWGFPTQEYQVPEKAQIEEALKLVDASAITIYPEAGTVGAMEAAEQEAGAQKASKKGTEKAEPSAQKAGTEKAEAAAKTAGMDKTEAATSEEASGKKAAASEKVSGKKTATSEEASGKKAAASEKASGKKTAGKKATEKEAEEEVAAQADDGAEADPAASANPEVSVDTDAGEAASAEGSGKSAAASVDAAEASGKSAEAAVETAEASGKSAEAAVEGSGTSGAASVDAAEASGTSATAAAETAAAGATASEEAAPEEETPGIRFGIDGMEIDLGGIAKGYTGNRVMEIFREYGIKQGLISLGGNVQALGAKGEDKKPWRIAIQNPEGNQEYLGILDIKDKAVITSGGYERYFEQDGVRYHHIIDPRTGYPADSGLVSVTIISEDGTLADGLSTSLFIMGREGAEKYWRAHSDSFDFILEETGGTLYVTEGVKDLLTTNHRTVVIKK